MCFCTWLWKINCTYQRVLWCSVMKGTNFNGSSSSPNSILMSVTMPLAPTTVHHPRITNLPHMKTFWLKIINITIQFNQVFIVVVVVFFSPPSILCFQKFCDFSFFFQRKISAIDINFFPNNFVKRFLTQKNSGLRKLFKFLFFLLTFMSLSTFLLSYFKIRVKGLVKLCVWSKSNIKYGFHKFIPGCKLDTLLLWWWHTLHLFPDSKKTIRISQSKIGTYHKLVPSM